MVVRQVLRQYEDLFARQPNFIEATRGLLEDHEGTPIPIVGILVHVSEEVDQEALPPQDRIPSCLDGIPIQFRVESCLEDAVSEPMPMAHRCAESWWENPLQFSKDVFTHSVEVTPQIVAYGETVVIKQTLKNVTNQKLQIVLAHGPPAGFLVTKPNGDYVFDSFSNTMGPAALGAYHLGPGEVEEFPGIGRSPHVWSLRYIRGQRVPPGTYLVRGLLKGMVSELKWMTDPVEVEILPDE